MIANIGMLRIVDAGEVDPDIISEECSKFYPIILLYK